MSSSAVSAMRGFACPGGPVAAGEVGEGDQRFPRVGRAVLDGHVGLGVAQLVEVGADPLAEAHAELLERCAVAAFAVAVDFLAGCPAAHLHHDGPVGDRVGQVADPGERGQGERGAVLGLPGWRCPTGYRAGSGSARR